MLVKPPSLWCCVRAPKLTETLREKGRGTACRPKALCRSMGAERATQILEESCAPGRCVWRQLEAANYFGRCPKKFSGRFDGSVSAISVGMPHQRAQLRFCRNAHRIPLLQVFPLPPTFSRTERYVLRSCFLRSQL